MGTGNDEEGLVNDQLSRRIEVAAIGGCFTFKCVWMRMLVDCRILLIVNRKIDVSWEANVMVNDDVYPVGS